MENINNIIVLILKALALAMAIASIVLGFLPEAADIDTQVTLLSIGLFTLAVGCLAERRMTK